VLLVLASPVNFEDFLNRDKVKFRGVLFSLFSFKLPLSRCSVQLGGPLWGGGGGGFQGGRFEGAINSDRGAAPARILRIGGRCALR
jgi:hypothetical protein